MLETAGNAASHRRSFTDSHRSLFRLVPTIEAAFPQFDYQGKVGNALTRSAVLLDMRQPQCRFHKLFHVYLFCERTPKSDFATCSTMRSAILTCTAHTSTLRRDHFVLIPLHTATSRQPVCVSSRVPCNCQAIGRVFDDMCTSDIHQPEFQEVCNHVQERSKHTRRVGIIMFLVCSRWR